MGAQAEVYKSKMDEEVQNMVKSSGAGVELVRLREGTCVTLLFPPLFRSPSPSRHQSGVIWGVASHLTSRVMTVRVARLSLHAHNHVVIFFQVSGWRDDAEVVYPYSQHKHHGTGRRWVGDTEIMVVQAWGSSHEV